MARQGRNIAQAFAQRRDGELDDVQPVIKILTERPGFDGLKQFGIGRSDNTDIGLLRQAGPSRCCAGSSSISMTMRMPVGVILPPEILSRFRTFLDNKRKYGLKPVTADTLAT